MWTPNAWSRIVGPGVLALVGVVYAVGLSWMPGAIAVAAAVGSAVSNNRTYVEVRPHGLRYQRPFRSFELRWHEVAGAIAVCPSLVNCELWIVDVDGRFRTTGVWRWRLPGSPGSLQGAVRAINAHATAIPDVAEVGEPELRAVLEEYRRRVMLRAAGLDERGAERLSDRIVGLWFLTLLGSLVVGGMLAQLSGVIWPAGILMAASLAGFVLWASRQPRLPPQRQAVRLPWKRTEFDPPADPP